MSIYIDYTIRTKSPVFRPHSLNMEMTTRDVGLLCDAAQKGGLNSLTELILPGNTLTNVIKKLVSDDRSVSDYPVFRSLERIDISNTRLNTSDVQSLFTAIHDGKFPKLKELQFLPAPLTDCLSVILKTAHHPAFPFSKDLMLQKSCLSKNDIKCLHKALCDGKLQDLREINLSDNMLTDCLIEILGKADLPRFEALQTY